MELDSNKAIKQTIDAGLGISMLSRHALALEGVVGQLNVLDVKGLHISWQWHVGNNKGKRLSITAKTILEFLKYESNNIMRIQVFFVVRYACCPEQLLNTIPVTLLLKSKI
jgi:hypothetical protein